MLGTGPKLETRWIFHGFGTGACAGVSGVVACAGSSAVDGDASACFIGAFSCFVSDCACGAGGGSEALGGMFGVVRGIGSTCIADSL